MIDGLAAPAGRVAPAAELVETEVLAPAPAAVVGVAPARRIAAPRWLAVLAGLALLGAGPVAAAPHSRAEVEHSWARTLVATDPLPAYLDAVAVHGGGGTNAERERPAADLLAAGRVDTIVALGGPLPRHDPDLTYAGAVVRRLRALAVPDESILRLDRGANTLGELRALRQLAEARGWRTVALATSPWHTRRVGLTAAVAFAGSPVHWYVTAVEDGERGAWLDAPAGHRYLSGEWAKIALLLVWPEGLPS